MKNYDYITREQLISLYYDQHRGMQYIANQLHISLKTLNKLFQKYGIDKKSEQQMVADRLGLASQTNLDRYGVAFSVERKDVQNKIKDTLINKYGVDNIFKLQSVQQKINESNIAKYGHTRATSNEQTKQKIVDTNLNKYGVEWSAQSDSVRQKISSTMQAKYGVSNALRSKDIRDKIHQTVVDKYGVDYFCLHPDCISASNGMHSGPNKHFAELMQQAGIQFQTEFVIGNYRYDFKVNNTLIEINPTYTHSTDVGYRGNNPIDKYYHLHKSQAAVTNGFRVLQVWDWDDINKVIELLKPRSKVYARKCEVREADPFQAATFISKYHLQGEVKASVYIGLFYEGDLISVMSFGKPRYNSHYQYELIRYCSSHSVIGGVEKMWSYFCKQYHPQSIISYCDASKFSGQTYIKLGMFPIKKSVSPTEHWYNIKTSQHFTANLVRQQGVDRLLGTEYGKGTSNELILLNEGFVRVWDCGQYAFVIEF